jgi:hypothetical protein
LARNVRAFCLQVSLSYCRDLLTCRKVLRHGTAGFTSPPKEVVLRVCTALKTHCPRPGLNLRTVGPLAITITTRPPRATKSYFISPYIQSFQNGGRSDFWGGYTTCTSQRSTMQFSRLIDLQRINNFRLDHSCDKPEVRTWKEVES